MLEATTGGSGGEGGVVRRGWVEGRGGGRGGECRAVKGRMGGCEASDANTWGWDGKRNGMMGWGEGGWKDRSL